MYTEFEFLLEYIHLEFHETNKQVFYLDSACVSTGDG